ncbi:GDSL-type esterase/lipase family protein [Streptosporangium vulgare]|uniref:GDSL-type esterase/lipase family protein n=1 Tax=Streptosporangium vulgare TaxID=46190 RepID=UPI0031E4240B
MLTTLLVTLSLLLQVGFQPVAQAATSITLDFPMPEGFDRADLTAWAADFNNRNDLLSETIQEEIASHPADFPGAEDLEPREFDGAFTVTGGGLSVTIEADVNINDLTWWEEVLMWVSVTAGGVVFRVACVLTLVPVMANPNFAKGICAGLAVIISKGLVLLITALKHGPSDDWHFWERALVGLVLEALTAAIWDAWFGPWTTKNSWSSVFEKIGAGFESVANTISRWWGSSAGFFRALSTVVRGRGPGTTQSTIERAMELGWMPRTTALRVLPLGDSITYGVGGSPGGIGYRGRLWDLLQDDTRSLDFVGSVDSGHGNIPDTDHEGHPRWRISQIDQLAAECAINRYRPNVVILHIGTNDLANDEDPRHGPPPPGRPGRQDHRHLAAHHGHRLQPRAVHGRERQRADRDVQRQDPDHRQRPPRQGQARTAGRQRRPRFHQGRPERLAPPQQLRLPQDGRRLPQRDQRRDGRGPDHAPAPRRRPAVHSGAGQSTALGPRARRLGLRRQDRLGLRHDP